MSLQGIFKFGFRTFIKRLYSGNIYKKMMVMNILNEQYSISFNARDCLVTTNHCMSYSVVCFNSPVRLPALKRHVLHNHLSFFLNMENTNE